MLCFRRLQNREMYLRRCRVLWHRQECLCYFLTAIVFCFLVGGAIGGEVRIVGPTTAEEVVLRLAEGYAETKDHSAGAFRVDYLKSGSAASAASTLLRDDVLMFWWDKIDDDTVRGRDRERWDELSPEEHVIGAITPAVIAHARNPVGSLTESQLVRIFSGRASGWGAFGGDDAAIRGYAMPRDNEVMRLLEDEWRAVRWRFTIQRRNSREVISSVSTDPGGIGIIDAAAEVSTGDAVKKLSVDGVRPNAQTIRDGTYPLARRLVMYVPPDASPAANKFVQFLLSDQANSLLRECALLPALREGRSEVVAGFMRLYGPEIERVRSTSDADDNIELAQRLLRSAVSMDFEPEIILAMCETAYELGFEVDGGETMAFRALHVLREEMPEREFDAAMKRVALYQRGYNTVKSESAGRNLVKALIHAAETATTSRRYGEAAGLWRRASGTGAEIGYERQDKLERRLPAFEARAESGRRVQRLAARLRDEPENDEVRRELLMTYLVELDSPAEAERLLRPADEETLKTNVPVAMQPVQSLSKDAALRLAEWYVGLAGEAGTGGRELMVGRAMGYYKRFYSLHEERSDSMAMRAALGIQKIGGSVPEPDEDPEPERDIADLRWGERITDLRLAEYAARNPDIKRLDQNRIGGAGRITDLRPLTHLAELTHLELRGAAGISDLSPLSSLSNLKSLTLTGLELGEFSPLAELSGLTSLNLIGAAELSDLTPVGQLRGLRTLNLSNCPEISNLRPLEDLPELTRLTLNGSENIRDLAPLEELSGTLSRIDLRGCTGISDIYPLSRIRELSRVDLRGCSNVAEADIEWLERQLPDCRIRYDN